MHMELEDRPARTPILKRAAASLILIGAAAIGIWIVIGVIKAIFWTAALIVVAVAVIWALKTIFW
jgi:hypothetical protein